MSIFIKKNSASLNRWPLHPTNLKKEKGFFFSFRFKTTAPRLRYIGRISEARCDLDEI
jgi:hypothetical protein